MVYRESKRGEDCRSRKQKATSAGWGNQHCEECFQHGIELEMAWIPKCENKKAHYLSRIVDYDDWQIDPIILIVIEGNTR